MNRLIKSLFWVFIFLVTMLIIDQFLVQVPPVHPAHATVRNFYRDLRSRIIEMTFGEKKAAPHSIEEVIEGNQKGALAEDPKNNKQIQQHPKTATDQTKGNNPQRYIYSDSNGELQFADSLEEIPEKFRSQAQPIGN
jgi:hypothetical protein